MTDYKTLEVKYMGERRHWKTPIYGEIWRWKDFWLMGCPACGQAATLAGREGGHTVILEGDFDVVTVSPSIGCPFSDCDAHYFVRDGKVVPA